MLKGGAPRGIESLNLNVPLSSVMSSKEGDWIFSSAKVTTLLSGLDSSPLRIAFRLTESVVLESFLACKNSVRNDIMLNF